MVPIINSTTSPTHRLIREDSRYTRHDDIQRRADINRHRCRSVCASRNASADNTHDPVQTDGDAVACAAVRRGQDLGSVGVKGTIVDVLFVFGLVTR